MRELGYEKLSYEERSHRMTTPYVSRMEHEIELQRRDERIAELEAELREFRRRRSLRRSGW